MTTSNQNGGTVAVEDVEKQHNNRRNKRPSISTQFKDAPEKKLTLFAVRLAVLENTASLLRSLGFVWATVVLLGGFAAVIEPVNFWVVTIILVIEGARIFSSGHQLEWEHQATRHIEQAPREPASYPSQRGWKSSEVPIVGRTLDSGGISRILYWLQLLCAAACVALSVSRLVHSRLEGIREADRRNRKEATNIFYGLALAEALLFLVEKGYYAWEIHVRKLLVNVSKDCGLGAKPCDLVPIRRFFYDAFSRCINGSLFDGAKMDLVSFSMDLLGSDFLEEQLMGLLILRVFTEKYSLETHRKIGRSTATVERLVEMLSWGNPFEVELREHAADVVSKIVSKKRNVARVADIPGYMESLTSLLQTLTSSYSCTDGDAAHTDHMRLNLLGLRILKNLAHNPNICDNMGSMRDLLPRIIQFTALEELRGDDTGSNTHLLRPWSDNETEDRVKRAKRSLKLLKMLAKASGRTAKALRPESMEFVTTVNNMRDIVHYAEEHPRLQTLAIEILASLPVNAEARARIGRTGCVISDLIQVFSNSQQLDMRLKAGEALAVLTIDSPDNCRRMLQLKDDEKFVAAINDPEVYVYAARILRNLYSYDGSKSSQLLHGAAKVPLMAKVLKTIMNEEKKPLEVSVGLALQIFRLMSLEETKQAFGEAGIKKTEFLKRLIDVLQAYNKPSVEEPTMRKYALELVVWMMKLDREATDITSAFKTAELEQVLKNVARTTSELELFSEIVESSEQETTIESLVKDAMDLLTR